MMNNQPDHNYQGDMMSNYPYSSGATVTTELIQKYLEENRKLIVAILDNQSLGRLQECATYQARLQNNLLYLAAIADAQSQPVCPTLPGRTSPMLQHGQLQYVQPQNHLQQQQIVNQSILGKDITHPSNLQPMHGIPQQQQQFFFHASPSSVYNPNIQFNMPLGSEMGGGLNSSGSIHDFSNGLTSSTTVQGNMVLDPNTSDHGDPNTTREGASGSGQGAQDSDTYLTLPEDGN
ncbi:hypothetical protein SUGI_1141460 [Cryptomeria japonica]|uniref:GRF1-interacting factor 2 n=1 Tax=Cryptomeria japonica TaxID=3369 RepID=UPI00241491A7|nr:GRF1-interacting factor 2 [Cryptomeria japonica]GLJ53500.1 hypothetical protein SUGI_1141460 [Cryptomeria japonica]